MSDSVWSSQVHARNAAIKAAREARDADRAKERERVSTAVSEGSDLAELSRDFSVSVETREEKSMKGFKASRPLPRDLSERIDNDTGPYGDALRKAREEGRVRYDVRTARWVVDGIKAPDRGPLSENGHFAPGMFRNTARRQAERQR